MGANDNHTPRTLAEIEAELGQLHEQLARAVSRVEAIAGERDAFLKERNALLLESAEWRSQAERFKIESDCAFGEIQFFAIAAIENADDILVKSDLRDDHRAKLREDVRALRGMLDCLANEDWTHRRLGQLLNQILVTAAGLYFDSGDFIAFRLKVRAAIRAREEAANARRREDFLRPILEKEGFDLPWGRQEQFVKALKKAGIPADSSSVSRAIERLREENTKK